MFNLLTGEDSMIKAKTNFSSPGRKYKNGEIDLTWYEMEKAISIIFMENSNQIRTRYHEPSPSPPPSKLQFVYILCSSMKSDNEQTRERA